MNSRPDDRLLAQATPVDAEHSGDKSVEQPLASREPQATKKPQSFGRLALMIGVPLLLVVLGAIVYVTGGRDVSTEDAYVKQDVIRIMPQVSGRIVAVGVRENETVHQGDLLFAIDNAPYCNAVDEAKAALASARLGVDKLKAAYRKAQAQRRTAADVVAIAQAQQKRLANLAKAGATSKTALDDANLTLQSDQGALKSTEQDIASAAAALSGNPNIPTDKHPDVMAAQARLDAAELDLSHTRLTAPATAVVTQVDSLQKGQYVTSGTTVLTLVRSGSTRIEANYKETDLTNMRVGQPARVTVDAYPDVKLKGTVESIGAGTGSAFALIPAQNATGNWVKVVQRLPVRIALEDARTLRSLRVGMSVTATVGTGHSRGLPGFISGVLETLGLSGLFDGPANGPSGAKR
jgi:membrane fusion protein (multidrug efflux system)